MHLLLLLTLALATKVPDSVAMEFAGEVRQDDEDADTCDDTMVENAENATDEDKFEAFPCNTRAHLTETLKKIIKISKNSMLQ